ncbi:MAG: hypothetical protein ACRDRS_03185 [Pseudonocardiaceae bacterium]
MPAALFQLADDVHAHVDRRREVVLREAGFAQLTDALADDRLWQLATPG